MSDAAAMDLLNSRSRNRDEEKLRIVEVAEPHKLHGKMRRPINKHGLLTNDDFKTLAFGTLVL